MENETIYMKTKKEGLWEECPAVACLGYMAIGLILFFVLFFSPFCYGIATENAIVVLLEPIAMILGLFSLGYFSVYKIVQTNNEKNISKSIAFINRDNHWYAIKLMYNPAAAGTPLYMPSGSIAQAATMPTNIKVASNIQSMENEIRKQRQDTSVFSATLTDVLDAIYFGSAKEFNASKADKWIDMKVNKYAFQEISTQNGRTVGYIILNNVRVVKVTKKRITLEFENEKNETKQMQFHNCYGGLVGAIKTKNTITPQS